MGVATKVTQGAEDVKMERVRASIRDKPKKENKLRCKSSEERRST